MPTGNNGRSRRKQKQEKIEVGDAAPQTTGTFVRQVRRRNQDHIWANDDVEQRREQRKCCFALQITNFVIQKHVPVFQKELSGVYAIHDISLFHETWLTFQTII